jgi:hypothetical protein
MACEDNCFIGYYKYFFDDLLEIFSRVNRAEDSHGILNLN